jgi:hypothetical protein
LNSDSNSNFFYDYNSDSDSNSDSFYDYDCDYDSNSDCNSDSDSEQWNWVPGEFMSTDAFSQESFKPV